MKSKIKTFIGRAILLVGPTLIGLMIGFFADVHELAALSNANHGYTKHAVMEGIRDEDVEYCAIFLGPIKILEYTSNRPDCVVMSDVCMPNKVIRYLTKYRNYVTMIHNHPNDGLDTSFSFDDLCYNALAINTKIVVSKHSTQTIRTQQSWPTGTEIENAIQTLYGVDIYTEDDPMGILASQDLVYVRDRKVIKNERYRSEAITVTIRVKFIQELSDELGMEFSIEKVE